MKKILLILFILSGISSFSQEKRNCGTNERLELYRKSHPESIKKSQVLEQYIQKWIDEDVKTKKKLKKQTKSFAGVASSQQLWRERSCPAHTTSHGWYPRQKTRAAWRVDVIT